MKDKEEKLRQLKVVFTQIINGLIDTVEDGNCLSNTNYFLDEYVNKLLLEVKIRI